MRWQFHHVIDVVPTLLEVTGIPAPDMVDGIGQKPIEGVSMAYSFDKANADAPSPHKIQYFEMLGSAGPLQRRLDAERRADARAMAIARRGDLGSRHRL